MSLADGYEPFSRESTVRQSISEKRGDTVPKFAKQSGSARRKEKDNEESKKYNRGYSLHKIDVLCGRVRWGAVRGGNGRAFRPHNGYVVAFRKGTYLQ